MVFRQSPVLFEETARLIPANAITIEIAPHGLLQAILRRSLKKDVINIPLTERKHQDNVQILFTALGRYVTELPTESAKCFFVSYYTGVSLSLRNSQLRSVFML